MSERERRGGRERERERERESLAKHNFWCCLGFKFPRQKERWLSNEEGVAASDYSCSLILLLIVFLLHSLLESSIRQEALIPPQGERERESERERDRERERGRERKREKELLCSAYMTPGLTDKGGMRRKQWCQTNFSSIEDV
jgi:hypothetical protein